MTPPHPATAPRAGTQSQVLPFRLPPEPDAHRPSPPATALIFAGRSLRKMTRMPEQMLDVLMIPVLFTLMFTYLFGGALAGSPHRYLHALLPGTMVMTVLLITMYTGSALNTDLTRGVYDRFRTLPIWQPAPLLGGLLADLIRYAITAILVLAVGLALGYRPAAGPVGAGAAIALITLVASGIGWIFTALGLILRTPNGVFTAGTLIVFPLTFASNTFVDPTTMPGWLRTLVTYNPVSGLVTTTRQILDGHPHPAAIAVAVAAWALMTAVFAPLSSYLFRHQRAGRV